MNQPTLQIIPMPKDTNPSGNIFGGWIMSQMDLAGAVMAKSICENVVTVAAENITFQNPVFVGDLVSIYTNISHIGNTSISVDMCVYVTRKDEKIQVAKAKFVYVSVDKQGKKQPIKTQQN